MNYRAQIWHTYKSTTRPRTRLHWEEILLVVLTKRSQLYILSKRSQNFCKTYQYLKVDRTKYATNFLLL